METKHVISALAALAQESRLAVFRLLVQIGPAGLAASKIAEQLAIPSSSLSFHLKELSHAELIVPRQDGRFIIYSANFDTMNQLMGFLTDSCCGGNPCSPELQLNCTDKTTCPS
jgi:DNA-binding transcriptional ArsR family regulator